MASTSRGMETYLYARIVQILHHDYSRARYTYQSFSKSIYIINLQLHEFNQTISVSDNKLRSEIYFLFGRHHFLERFSCKNTKMISVAPNRVTSNIQHERNTK